MNNILELKGNRFTQESRKNTMGGASMNGDVTVVPSHINRLQEQLHQIRSFWKEESRPFKGLLISVHYNKIAAKSNRICGIFKGNKSNLSIVGAKFNDECDKHIITYLLLDKDLEKSITQLESAKNILTEEFDGEINKAAFNYKDEVAKTKLENIDFKKYKIDLYNIL